MLSIICGEDIVASRAYLQTVIEQYKEKDFEIQFVPADQIIDLLKTDAGVISLFGQKKLYVIENLNKTLKRRTSGALMDSLGSLEGIDVLTWEEGVGKRELKIQTALIKEFKLPQNIFQFVDSCYPANLKRFVQLLRDVSDGSNDMFLYIMLARHVRNLVFVALGSPPSSLQSWQVGKLKRQASSWEQEKLLDFYDKLIGFDTTLKTGTNPYPLKDSMELLACYYLK